MSKVFGYPKFDEYGEMILTTYDNDYKAMMMDIRVYNMKAGYSRTFKRDGEEIAVLLLSGKVTYAWEDEKATVSRKDVFTEGPWGTACKWRKRDHRDSRRRVRDFGTVHTQ